MQSDFALVDALMGGTDAMRAAGTKYLPQFPLESDDAYSIRKETSVLFPAYQKTHERMVGRVFAKPVRVADAVSDQIKEICKNVDRQQRNLSVFASSVFGTAFNYGLSHILVDMPIATGETLADGRNLPYMAHISPKNVLGWRESNGELTQLRLSDSIKEDDGEFGEVVVPIVTVLEPKTWRKYKKDKEGWSLYDSGENSLGKIPLVTIYAKRTGFMTGEPPLKELAHLNIKHWQSQSDQDNLIHVARVPLLVRIGNEGGGDITIGKSVIDLPQNGNLRFVEHTGAAIGAGRQALQDLITEMQLIGAKLLQPSNGVMTATQAKEEGADTKSPLAMIAENLRDGLDAALQLMADWLKLGDGGNVDLTTDLDNDLAPVESMSIVNTLVASGALSPQTAFEEAKRRGIIDENLDWETEQTRIGGDIPKPKGVVYAEADA